MYTQLTTDIPDNDTALDLVRKYSFYDLYWILTTKIFGKYGQGSTRAEAELAKIILLKVAFNGQMPDNRMGLSFYQYGAKKWVITMNEYLRDTQPNPECIATGHDRHVLRIARFFNPYLRSFDDIYCKILCRVCKNWILWNFNEVAGQMQQCLNSGRNTKQESFAIHVMRDLIGEFPEYNSLVMHLVKERQWEEIYGDGNN